MKKRLAGFASAVVLVLGLPAFAGSALAGNGNGNGNATPGNSATAPGQEKKGDAAVPIASEGGSADQNANPAVSGVKPTSSTAKGNKPTSCTTGGGQGSSATCTSTGSQAATAQTAAHADASKRYGSGTTAAQIANSRGAPAGTKVHGPGNSQPHKVAKCPGSGKFVDVHAVKSYSALSCAAQSPATTNAGKSSNSSSNTTASTSVTASTAGTTAAGAAATTGATTQQGGVLGATVSESKQGAPEGGVLGAIEAAGEGVLPFTGFPLWTAALVALALIALGLTLRRRTRATV